MNPFASSSSSKRKWDSSSYDDDDEPESRSRRPKHDVFINYSFKDIGKTFISHLEAALIRNSFAISDHTMLPVGQDMRLELLKAMEESEIYVVVFSPHYASSVRSLDELVDIMDSLNKFDQRKVLPVFYKVEPSDVRRQKGPFMEPFQAHQTNTDLDPERVLKWRLALTDAGNLSGLPLQNEGEAKFVLKIIEELEKMQRPQELIVTDHPVGVGSRAEELISTLKLDQKDCVLVVAVFGISGIGKTTIVKEAFNIIAPSFEVSCFLADIHYICQIPNWKVKLPKALISCLSRENKFSIMSNHNEGVTKIRRLVRNRKVLLVLDDVDNFQQLESLGICPNWFYEGSRIIVITRDKRSLGNVPYVPYHTKFLNRRESLNLFTRLMFGRDDPINTKFLEEVTRCAGGIPLVLKVWSRHFKQFKTEEWPSILETLKRIPHGDVQKQLQMSYDSLTPRLKKLFLDIVCFFHLMGDKDLIVKLLQDEDSGFLPNNEIQYLADKSLVYDPMPSFPIFMHDAIREMGLEVVRQENEDEPGQRTRLWDPKDVTRVLTEYSGTEAVESIRMEHDYSSRQMFSLDAFKKMTNLRLISISCTRNVFSDDEMTHLCFKKLKYMSWAHFPFKSLDNIDVGNVVVLKLISSKLETLWEGIKGFKRLRILNLSYSMSLTKTGNFSGLENLEELSFEDCINLQELHSSIGDLQKLAILNLESSVPLNRVPWEMIGKLPSLQELTLGNELEAIELKDNWLSSLKESPMTNLNLYGCNLPKFSGGVLSLAWLKHLSLYYITIPSHSDSLLQLHELDTIDLRCCNDIQSIPNLPANITSINAWSCESLVNLPYNICQLKSLKIIHIVNCHQLGAADCPLLVKVTRLANLTCLRLIKCSLSQIPTEIGNLVSLKKLDLSENPFSSLPYSISNLSQLLYLNVESCDQLRLLPLLPPNLKNIGARECRSLDVMSSASIRTKVCKEARFKNRLIIQLPWKNEVPDWFSYQSRGDVLSFVAPVNNICGIIICANTSRFDLTSITSEVNIQMHNKIKNTTYDFKLENKVHGFYHNSRGVHVFRGFAMWVLPYPLDDTTLLVEPGDSMVLKFPQGSVMDCGLRLIYENDVMDCNLAFLNRY